MGENGEMSVRHTRMYAGRVVLRPLRRRCGRGGALATAATGGERPPFSLPSPSWRLADAMAPAAAQAEPVSDDTIREIARLSAIELREGTEDFRRAKADFSAVLACLESVRAYAAAHPSTPSATPAVDACPGTPLTDGADTSDTAFEAAAEAYVASLRDDIPAGLGFDATQQGPESGQQGPLGSSRRGDQDTAALAGAVPRSTLLAATRKRKGSFYAIRHSDSAAPE
jgi:hypothetical protein